MMNEDEEFSFMHNVFMPVDRGNPDLPFSEFITDSGLHKLSGSGKYPNHFFAQYSIPRDSGTIGVSIVSGSLFHCSPDAPYEVMINGAGDPRRFVTDEQLMILLAKLIAGEDIYE
jgi:hypothetical protein